MGSLLVDAMSAVDDLESFAFFMGTIVADAGDDRGQEEAKHSPRQRRHHSHDDDDDGHGSLDGASKRK